MKALQFAQRPQQGYSTYYPTQTTGGFDLNTMIQPMMMIMVMGMMMGMMKPMMSGFNT